MKTLIILSSALLGLCSSASAFLLDLTTLTGTLGTQVVNVAGYGNVTLTGQTNVSTSPFGLVFGAGDSLSVTFTSGPVTNLSSSSTFGPVVGSVQTAATSYLFTNAASPTGQTTAFVSSISFDEDTSVPEPSSALLLTLGASSMLLRRRK